MSKLAPRSLSILFGFLLLITGLACNTLLGQPLPDAPITASTATLAVTAPPPTIARADPATDTATAPTATTSQESATAWPAPEATAPGRQSQAPLTADQERTWDELANSSAPVRDDVTLAQMYQGVPNPLEVQPANGEPPAVGQIDDFTVLNIDSNINVSIEAIMVGSSEHAHFWFDTDTRQPSEADIQVVGETFDEIYKTLVAAFGPEDRPGIDGDLRVHVVHASPAALCDDPGRCGLAGYFSSTDALPRAVRETSNEREMFVMNADTFGTGFYLNVLAHEFRHMIEDNHDRSDADWEIEGSAMLAEELAGYTENTLARGNAFLENPDQQLNFWPENNTYTYYGQGYLLNRYIYDRLGPELYREFASHPDNGLHAVTSVAEANNLDLDGHRMWLDWLAALAIHNHPQAPDRYRLGDGRLNTAAMVEVDRPETFDTTVRQYAADYYRLQGDGQINLQFAGSRQVPLLDTAAASGQQYWYANRTNFSHMQLTRAVDLRSVSQATLHYHVYHDIEVGYDFAYVSVSRDGGQTWQGLVADNMQGLEERHNPAGTALTDRFYTGQSDGWVEESIDLTQFTGEEILLSFSYVTDPILTYGGLAVDNISIPEIGFYDDAESDVDGWESAGFTRATATLPQGWQVQLITFANGSPQVTALDLEADQTLAHTVDLGQSDGEAILIVAAYAPLTLEEAVYQLQIE
ncbi:MAG TPA: hypothetical protein VK879_05210 [Candidatus Sulfomarinibacteraceae bacterium]|nr:hypothetical protein [Candidatus Sulfomarinibacteraceae bacterium]